MKYIWKHLFPVNQRLRKMLVSDSLAIIGGFTISLHLLKLIWRCWCGFKQFFLSKVWHVDLKTFGRWAGKLNYVTCA